MHTCTTWQISAGLRKNYLTIVAHWKSPDTPTMPKRRRDESLGSCISTTDPSAMPSFAKRVPTHTPVMVKHHGGGLGKCVSKDAFASPDHMVLSTSYRCLPGAKMILKTPVLGFALPQKPISCANTLLTSKLGTMEVTRSDLNNSDPWKEQRRPHVNPSYGQ